MIMPAMRTVRPFCLRSPISSSRSVAAALLLTLCATAFAQSAERPADAWAALNAQVQQAYRDAHYDQGAELGAEALALAEKRFGSQDTRTIMSANNLALNYDALGKLDAAEPLYVRALQSHERVYGPDHPLTLISLTNLAGLYLLRGRFDEAEAMLRKVVDARIRQFGEDSEDTARARHNLQALQSARMATARPPPPIAASEQTPPPPAPDQSTTLAMGSSDLSAMAFLGGETDPPAAKRLWGLLSFLPFAPSVDALAGERDARRSPSHDRPAPPPARVADAPVVRGAGDAMVAQTVRPMLLFDLAALSFGEDGDGKDEPVR